MRYKLAHRVDRETEIVINHFYDFTTARRHAVALLTNESYHIVGYHLTEVHNAPLHAEFFVVFPDKTHAVYTITEAE